MQVVNIQIWLDELDVLGIGWWAVVHDNNARRFARVRKHYYSRRDGENDGIFSKGQACIQSKVGYVFWGSAIIPSSVESRAEQQPKSNM